MPSDFWEEMDYSDTGEPFEWDDVERLSVLRDDDSWTVWAEVDGEWVEIATELDDDTMEVEFWGDLYFWAMDEGVDVDREIGYE